MSSIESPRPSPYLAVLVRRVDWMLFVAALLLTCAGLVTMNSFVGENSFFEKQLVWATGAVAVFFALSVLDFRFLRRTYIIVGLYIFAVISLLLVLGLGEIVKGAQSRFDIGIFAIQPADPVKLILILILAKYFSRRHIAIANFRHILVSGFYTFVLFVLVFLQPDFGSAIILLLIWLGMVLVAGISKKHLLLLLVGGIAMFALLWTFAFADYQKDRIRTFLNPLTDLQGTGYNAYQSTVAVGSGQIFGKGVGYGTQSKLAFLPEYETDFIFAAFAEEWGFVGVALLFGLFVIVFWRIIAHATRGASNFEILFGVGVAVLFMSHFVIHVGMNIGLLPVTGTTIPFMSYGGSHLLTEFIALGMLMGMSGYSRSIHKDDTTKEFLGA
ncbi:MAG TPA: FtsW/RodA/SpoVE family cell cycle protein [Candidatus Paceibacterota bacterium]